jgi:hypothetical protein
MVYSRDSKVETHFNFKDKLIEILIFYYKIDYNSVCIKVNWFLNYFKSDGVFWLREADQIKGKSLKNI